MKKILLVAPACLLFAFCSRKTVPPPPEGISNVNVGRGDTMAKAEVAAAALSTNNRDWAYRSNSDTTLNGTWTLNGIMTSDGSWSSLEPAEDTTVVSDTALTITPGTLEGKTGKSTSKKTKKNSSKVLYDSANAKLKRDFKAGSAIDTTALPAYEYWKRIPSVTIDAFRQVFSGNTGCNSMSGPFHFNNNEIQFGKNIVTSKMACNDYDENVFLSALQKADNYTLNGNILELRQGSTLLLTFKKS